MSHWWSSEVTILCRVLMTSLIVLTAFDLKGQEPRPLLVRAVKPEPVSIPPAVDESDVMHLYAISDSIRIDTEGGVLQFEFQSFSGNCQNLAGPGWRYYSGSRSRLTTGPYGTAAVECSFNGYDDLWFSFVPQYDSLGETVTLLDLQFRDLASRLDILHTKRQQILERFGQYKADESFLEDIDQDIRHLSALGARLKQVTDRFFATIKPRLIEAEIQREILDARKQAMTGLKSFEDEINKVTAMPDRAIDHSLEEIVAAVDRAVRELERAKDN